MSANKSMFSVKFLTMCFLFIMPCAVFGADLTIGTGVTSTGGDWTLTGNMTANSFLGNGANLTGLNPANLSSGTANISILGNAAAVTNGIYTTGSYVNPTWITSLDGAKITGNISVNNLILPTTTATVGQISLGGGRFIHGYAGNTFIGQYAGNTSMTGSNNTGSGGDSLYFNTTGSNNTASGTNSLFSNTTASNNTAFGEEALFTQSFSNLGTAYDSNNTAIGFKALFSNQPTTTNNGVRNTAVGSQSLLQNTTGFENTAIGYHSLNSNTTGLQNTAIGEGSLHSNSTGLQNTAIGDGSLYANTTGTFNTAIGTFADVATGNLYNATAIGAGAYVTESNKIRLGNALVTVIEANVNVITLSDIRAKKDIKDITFGLDFIKALKPVEFKLKNGNDRIDFGFIAQDIEELVGTEHNILGIGNDEARTLSLRYTDFIAPMVKALQEQQQIIDNLNDEIVKLNDINAKQIDGMQQMRKELDEFKALISSTAKR